MVTFLLTRLILPSLLPLTTGTLCECIDHVQDLADGTPESIGEDKVGEAVAAAAAGGESKRRCLTMAECDAPNRGDNIINKMETKRRPSFSPRAQKGRNSILGLGGRNSIFGAYGAALGAVREVTYPVVDTVSLW